MKNLRITDRRGKEVGHGVHVTDVLLVNSYDHAEYVRIKHTGEVKILSGKVIIDTTKDEINAARARIK